MRLFRPVVIASVAAVILLGGGIAYWLLSNDPGDPRLQVFVHSKTAVPIVFTSRTEPLSFQAPAPVGEGFTEPGIKL